MLPSTRAYRRPSARSNLPRPCWLNRNLRELTMCDHASPLLDRDYSGQPEALTPAYKSSRLRAPCQPLLRLPETVRDVTGPVFGHDMLGELDANLVINAAAPNQSALGPRILVHGCVVDSVSFKHLRAHSTVLDSVCRLPL